MPVRIVPLGLNWGFGEGQAGPCMGRLMAWCMVHGIVPGLMRLKLSIGGGLVGDGEEVIDVVSGLFHSPSFILLLLGV